MADIVLKNKDGVETLFSGVHAVVLDTEDGGEAEFIQPELSAVTVTPTGKDFTVNPDGDGFNAVTVEGDANLTPANIRKDVTIYGVTGNHACEEPDLDPVTLTPTGKTFTRYPGGDGFSSVTVQGDANLTPDHIVDGITIYGVTGTHECPVLQNMDSIDMTEWAGGSFIETYVDGTSVEREVTFDDDNRPVSIESLGSRVTIEW